MANNAIDAGPLEPLLADAAVTAIFIDDRAIRFEKDGATQTSDISFENDAQRWQFIMGVLEACGLVLTPDQPTADGVLADGTQVSAQYVPLTLSLRKARAHAAS